MSAHQPTPSAPQGWSFETRQIHAGQEPDPVTGAPVIPSCSDWTSVRPASMTMMPDAMTLDGCMSKGVSPESS